MGSATCETKRRHDLVQRVMLLTIAACGAVRETDQIGSFILGVSRTMAVDVKRRERRRERLREAFVRGTSATGVARRGSARPRATGKLPRTTRRPRADDRALDVLRWRSARQVGEEMTMTEGVRVARHRAIGKLRACAVQQGQFNGTHAATLNV